MQDPRTKYPTPPFGEQPQPVPGLAREMSPKPDHGEKSYRGSGRLEGRKRTHHRRRFRRRPGDGDRLRP